MTTIKTNIINQKFAGAATRQSLLDVIFTEKANKPLIVFLHGFKGFKDWGHFPKVAAYLAKNNFNVLKFNFSHNGGTAENPIDFPDLEAFSENMISKELVDLNCILKWIKKEENNILSNINVEELYLLGHSRGGGVALLAANQFTVFKKVVTWAAVDDFISRLPNEIDLNHWKEKGERIVKNGRTKQDMPIKYSYVLDLLSKKDELNIELSVKKSKLPILLIHGEMDETVKLSAAKNIANWNKKASLKIINGGNHTFGGKQPYTENDLPQPTLLALKETIKFLNA